VNLRHLLFLDLTGEHFTLVFEATLKVNSLLFGQLAPSDHGFNLAVDLFVAFFELNGLCSKHINIVIQRIVLLLSLNKCGHDLFNVGDARRLLDLVEGVLNDLHIAEILVHQLSLFFVGVNNFHQSALKNNNRVRKVRTFSSGLFIALHVFIEVLVVSFDGRIGFFETKLQLLNLIVKSLALIFSFGL